VTSTRERRDAIAAFLTAHATRLHSIVGRSVHAPEPTIEDACQTAWTILLRRPDITLDDRGLASLMTVAIRAAWRLASTALEPGAGAET